MRTKLLLNQMQAGDVVVALEKMTELYADLVNSGDAGHWNPETETQMIAARAAIKQSYDANPDKRS
jgi:hypothetical protein